MNREWSDDDDIISVLIFCLLLSLFNVDDDATACAWSQSDPTPANTSEVRSRHQSQSQSQSDHAGEQLDSRQQRLVTMHNSVLVSQAPPPSPSLLQPCYTFQTVLLVFVLAEVTLCTLDISILGNKFINTDYKYRTDPGAGLRNR